MVNNNSIVLEVTVSFDKLTLTPTQVLPQLDTQNAHDHYNTAQHKGKFGREEGMERGSNLNRLWLKYLTFANFIKPYDYLKAPPGPSGYLGGAHIQESSEA